MPCPLFCCCKNKFSDKDWSRAKSPPEDLPYIPEDSLRNGCQVKLKISELLLCTFRSIDLDQPIHILNPRGMIHPSEG